jgi:hypothetical protein
MGLGVALTSFLLLLAPATAQHCPLPRDVAGPGGLYWGLAEGTVDMDRGGERPPDQRSHAVSIKTGSSVSP